MHKYGAVLDTITLHQQFYDQHNAQKPNHFMPLDWKLKVPTYYQGDLQQKSCLYQVSVFGLPLQCQCLVMIIGISQSDMTYPFCKELFHRNCSILIYPIMSTQVSQKGVKENELRADSRACMRQQCLTRDHSLFASKKRPKLK